MEDSSTAKGKNAASKQLPKQKWWYWLLCHPRSQGKFNS